MVKFNLNKARKKQAFMLGNNIYRLDKGELPEDAFKYAKKKFGISAIKEKKEKDNGKQET